MGVYAADASFKNDQRNFYVRILVFHIDNTCAIWSDRARPLLVTFFVNRLFSHYHALSINASGTLMFDVSSVYLVPKPFRCIVTNYQFVRGVKFLFDIAAASVGNK